LYKGYDLTLNADPAAEEILGAVDDPAAYEEIVFSGYGEPTLRLDVVKEVARALREQGAKRIRLVTNGLGSRTNGRDILPELRESIDALSVSVQAGTAEAYAKVCKPKEDIEDPFTSVKDFARRARIHFADVEITAVDMPGIDMEECKRMAQEELGLPFRERTFDLVD
jgi:TatD DNase family protein